MNERKSRLLYILVDYLSTLLGVVIFTFVRCLWVDKIHQGFAPLDFFRTQGFMLTLLIFPVFMLLIYYLSGFYVTVVNKSRVKELMSTLGSIAVGSLCFFMVVLLNDVLPKRTLNYELLLMLFCILFSTVYLCRLSLTSMLLSYAESKHSKQRLVFIGDTSSPENTDSHMLGPRIEIVEIVDIAPVDNNLSAEQLKSLIESRMSQLTADAYEGFMVSLPASDQNLGLRILGELYTYGKPIYVNADNYRILTSKVVYDNLFTGPIMDVTRSVQSDMVVSLKRAGDVLFSALAMIVVSPVVAGLALAVRLGCKGPAFYSQERIGLHRKPFRLYKLRSMVTDAEASGPALSSVDDPRITPIGRFMRKYRLDELPNLWNVFRGDMSLVGPRPEREYFLSRMRLQAPYCTLLHQVRPGLTSLGMVKFGYASSVDEMLERLKYDLIYIQNLSLSLDLKILIYTIRTVFRGEGK